MRFFFDGEVLGEGTSFNVTPAYIELRASSVQPPGTSFLYAAAGPLPYSMTVSSCWGNDLDSWLPLFNDEQRAADWIKVISATYPTIGRLLDATAADDLGRTALRRNVDPDDMRLKWFATISVGNLMPPEVVTMDSAREFLRDARLVHAYRVVLDDSFAAAKEISTRQPSAGLKAAMYGKEYVRSQVWALETFSKWAPKLGQVFGAGS